MLKNIIFSFIASFSAGILFNVRKKSLMAAGITGMLGWLLYIISKDSLNSVPIAAFFSSTLIGFVSEFFARKYKSPSTVFLIPGIVPLVPGASMYYSMLELTKNNLSRAAIQANNTVFIALAISCGIVTSVSITRLFFKIRK